MAQRPTRSREAARLTIAIGLLLIAGLTSALAALPGREAGTAQQLAFRSRFLRGEFSRFRFVGGSARVPAAELERRDAALRLIAGLEPAEDPVVALPDSSEAGSVRPAVVTRASAAYARPVDLGSVIRRARLESFSLREAEDSVVEYRERLARTPSIVPAVSYIYFSSGFSRARQHPILALRRPHRGLDIVAPYGSPIVAPARGRISFVGYAGEYGLVVEIDHGRGLATRFAHASKALVRPGQLVARGDTIARVGRSGLADGPHLHYEVLVNGEPRNPRRYLVNPGVAGN